MDFLQANLRHFKLVFDIASLGLRRVDGNRRLFLIDLRFQGKEFLIECLKIGIASDNLKHLEISGGHVTFLVRRSLLFFDLLLLRGLVLLFHLLHFVLLHSLLLPECLFSPFKLFALLMNSYLFLAPSVIKDDKFYFWTTGFFKLASLIWSLMVMGGSLPPSSLPYPATAVVAV